MAKYMTECPYCGALNRASTFVLSKKEIICGNCKKSIDVRENRMTSRKCPHCSNIFVYDQSQSRTVCPACHKRIDLGQGKLISFPCPQCSCVIQIDSNAKTTTCPVCDYEVLNVPQEFAKTKLVNDNGVSVIKYEGDNGTFVWKHPIEDFNLGTQLIVHQSQEAVFFLGGKALDTFGPGRYTLETENLPILKKVYQLPANNANPFHAEVYFINKTTQMGIKWGTDSRVRFVDPNTKIPLDIGASGVFNLAVNDSRRLLERIIGTTGGLTRGQIVAASAQDGEEAPTKTAKGWSKLMQGLFRPVILTKVKSHLASAIKNQNIDILEIDEKLELLSEALREKVSPDLEKYGLIIPEFYVTNVSLPENDPNFQRIRSLRSTVYLAQKEAEAEARITEAQREVMKAQQQTQIERARLEMEQKKILKETDIELEKRKGLAGVEVEKEKGLAEARVMSEKGYTQRDVIQADVQKSYAASIGEFGRNGGGTVIGSGGNGMMNDVMGLGVGLAAAKAVGGQMNEMLGDMQTAAQKQPEQTGWRCSCGQGGNTGGYCSNCGLEKPEPWRCLKCGAQRVLGNFCNHCGAAKPVLWTCPHCGSQGNHGNFCSDCGRSRETDTWDCLLCGARENHGNFCSECGKPRTANNDTWTCSCGAKGNKGSFCSVCGAKREDDNQ